MGTLQSPPPPSKKCIISNMDSSVRDSLHCAWSLKRNLCGCMIVRCQYTWCRYIKPEADTAETAQNEATQRTPLHSSPCSNMPLSWPAWKPDYFFTSGAPTTVFEKPSILKRTQTRNFAWLLRLHAWHSRLFVHVFLPLWRMNW